MIPSFFQRAPKAKLMLFAALLIGACIAATHLIFYCGIDYRDSANVYSFMARSFAEGNYADAFHPAIPPMNVLFSRVFTVFGVPADLAMSIVSCLFYLATVPVLYLFLKCFVPDYLAAFGALLYATAPKIIRFSCTGLIDSGKIFFLVAGMFFSCRLVLSKFRSYGFAVGFGAALGGLSLARSEGIGNAAVLFGCTALFWLAGVIREKRITGILTVLTTAAVWALTLGGRVWINWHFYGRAVYDGRLHDRFLSLLGKPTSGVVVMVEETASAPAESSLEFWLELLRKNVVGNYEVYFGLEVLCIVLLILTARGGKWSFLWPDRKVPDFFRWHPFFIVPVLAVVFNILIFGLTRLHAYRYFLINIPIFMIFSVMACWWIWSWAVKLLPRPLFIAGIIGIVVILFFQVENGVNNIISADARQTRQFGRQAGEIMRGEKADGTVFFRSACIEWYYSGMKRAVPIEKAVDPATFSDFDFALFCKDEDNVLPVIEQRDDLQEIPLSPDSSVKLFRKLNKE